MLMNPQDGEIFAMVNTPEFNLNTPFELIDVDENTEQTDEQTQVQSCLLLLSQVRLLSHPEKSRKSVFNGKN